MNALLDELEQRGFLSDCTNRRTLEERLNSGPIRAYVGFDPTADSLHVGSMMPLMVQRIIRRHGHDPVLLIGGATGMIGDPSGRSSQRNLLSAGELDHNRAALRLQIVHLVGDGDEALTVVDNREWFEPMGALELLREVGTQMPVNAMLARDSVRLRRESEAGISFTELSYQLLQAFDFLWLRRNLDVELQLGGSDQWGNITAGTDLIRRNGAGSAWGLVWPLMTKADGSKFGKTSDGNVWLDASRTSVFDFWQFWFNLADDDVEQMLFRFSERPTDELRELIAESRSDPGRSLVQRTLANEVTSWVHGSDNARRAEKTAALLFGSESEWSDDDLDIVIQQLGSTPLARRKLLEMTVVDASVATELCRSRREARQLIAEGGLRLGALVVAEDRPLAVRDLSQKGRLLLRRGRRTWAIAECIDGAHQRSSGLVR